MICLGAKAPETREMFLDDIYFLRLSLLFRMIEDYIDGRRLTQLRRQIVLDNARHIKSESIALGGLDPVGKADPEAGLSIFVDHCFYQCACDLAELMEMVALGQELDGRRQQALQEKYKTIRHIQRMVRFGELFSGFAN
jgi:hypothetical protein